MYNHAPEGYTCPICVTLEGIEDDRTMIRKTDIVYQDDLVTAFVGSFFVGNNPPQPLVVPNRHYENLYDMPEAELHRIASVSKLVSVALKESYGCDGVMVRQNNEPASSQHAFHYHMHVFPRYTGDKLDANMSTSRQSTAEERKPYADKLRKAIERLHHQV